MALPPLTGNVQWLRERFRGALLGTAIGDALGAPFEGPSVVDPRLVEEWVRSDERLRWTDDTHMMIGVAESLLAHDGFDAAHMVGQLARNWRAEPWRGYGGGPPRVFQAVLRGGAWEQAARALYGGVGSFGNGAAMRVAPVALAACPHLEVTGQLARLSAQLTHTHQLAQHGAALQACALTWLLDERNLLDRQPAGGLLEAVREAAPAPQFQRRLARLPSGLTRWSTQEAAARLGNGVAAVEAVPAALFCFLRHPNSFPEAVVQAVRLGGDTDTIAAMAGALAGAWVGASRIPASWRSRLEDAQRLVGLADALLEARLR